MNIVNTNLEDCYVIEPLKIGDERGYFSPYFIKSEYCKKNIKFENIVQANRSKSHKGVVRGLHFQKNPKCQSKIVEVIKGSAIDVVVDIRYGSPTFGNYFYILLTDTNNKQLFIPKGFAHGFVSLEDNTIFQYLVDNDYAPELEDGVLWNDPEIDIPWNDIFKKYNIKDVIISEKDKKYLSLSKSPKYFEYIDNN